MRPGVQGCLNRTVALAAEVRRTLVHPALGNGALIMQDIKEAARVPCGNFNGNIFASKT